MKFPALRPIVTKASGLSEVPFEMEEEEEEPNFDIPQSKEEKPAAYPNGPICIYPAGVYLYFEPTPEQAASFDVIVNVASEVQNPFTSYSSESQRDLNKRRVDGPAAENVDFAALSAQPKTTFGFGNDSPTTPKASAPVLRTIQPGETTINGKIYRTPEYIHMPWEHNTDIVPDLYKLVKIMDDRVKQGKRVLVHCQCGVSRSASLVVAYGLYKDPEVSVQEAYDKAKKRSKWIGPNMNLIMQLQEFRNGLIRQNQSNRTQNQGYGRRVGFPSSANANNRFSCPNPGERDDGSGSRVPQTAPLPPDNDISMQRASTGNMMAISPGPLSAPSGAFAARFRNSWDSSKSSLELSNDTTPVTTPYVDPKGHVIPVVEVQLNGSTAIPATPEVISPALEPISKAASVPNFSRQLSLRSYQDAPAEQYAEKKSSFLAPMAPSGPAPLKSPSALTFSIPSFSMQEDREDDYEMKSPVKASFDLPWPSEYDEPAAPSLSVPKAQGSFQLGAPPKSPMFAPAQGFRLGAPPKSPMFAPPQGFQLGAPPKSPMFAPAQGFQLGAPPKSPMFAPEGQGSFQLGAPPKSPMFAPPRMTLPKMRSDRSEKPSSLLPFRAAEQTSEPAQSQTSLGAPEASVPDRSPGFASPTFGSFPTDAFGPSSAPKPDLTSPRGAEFHMAPFRPTVADDDPFGLTSPTRRDFSSGNQFANRSSASSIKGGSEDRRPAFQAILPPAHQTFNGFASLDGHARTPSTQTLDQAPAPLKAPVPLETPAPLEAPAPLQAPPPKRKLKLESHINSFDASPKSNRVVSMPTVGRIPPPPPMPESPRAQDFLATPAKTIRTRFSSPNMKEQRQLSKLQTEMESKLANRPERPQQAMDDLDALMSPRAEEFTRNPFHLDLTSPTEEVSPASSDETIKDGKNGHTWSDPPRQWTPEKLTVDPRSPAQLGSSPIVRNIWDVL
jgi:tyrosine-protein phosphatase